MQQPVKIIRGTSHVLNVELKDDSGSEYILAAGETLRFALKHRPENKDPELTKDFGTTEYDATGHCYVLRLSPAETETLKLGLHFYDIGMQSGTDYIPVIECSTFDVSPNISSRTVTNNA